MAINLHYARVLGDLEEKRSALYQEAARIRKELEELDRLMAAIRKVAPEETEQQQSLALNTENARALPNLSGMSMRWGVLCVLVDYAIAPMSSTEIADCMEKGGLPDRTGKMRKNVGAVLSRMVGLQEVENAGNSYSATSFGKDMWDSIKRSPRFLVLHSEGSTGGV